MVADMGPLTAFHLWTGPASKMGRALAVQMVLMRLRMQEVETVHLYTNQVICSTTARVQGSYLGPSLMATVARGHPCAPVAPLAAARMLRWRLAR